MQYYKEKLTLKELFYFSLDLKSTYKSLWFGPVLVCWNFTWPEWGLWIARRPD